ncbi:MAG: arcB [Bacteroidetes bacterium]|nr:arcB [Bacteroidota bacterium]
MLIPSGTAIGVLYIIPMTLVLQQTKPAIVVFAVISSILIITDVLIHKIQDGIDLHYSVYGDRILALAAVWIVCFILFRYRILFEEKDRKQQSLLKSVTMYNQLLDNLIEGAQIIGHDWKYKYVNDAVVKQSGLTKDQLINSCMTELYPGIEKTVMYKTLQECMQTRIPKIFENEFPYPNGSVGHFKLSIEPIDQGIFILSMDITERKRRENNQERYTEELERMIFITSHKVRQPVAHILGLAQLMEKHTGTQEELDKMLKYVKDSALNLDKFTQELTHFINGSQNRNKE